MKFRIVSDLHIDVEPFCFNKLETDYESILILAGDCFNSIGFDFSFFKEISRRFYHIIYVLGNHEYYFVDFNFVNYLKAKLCNFNNIHILDNESITIDNINFIGSTLWSDLQDLDLLHYGYIIKGISDFKLIKDYDQNLLTIDSYNKLYQSSLNFIKQELDKLTSQNNIVVTHHSPSHRNIPDKYKNNILNPAFHSNLEDLILKYQPKLWIHGHTHTNMDYDIGSTKILCNPRGYKTENLKGFNPNFVINLGE